MSHTILRVVMLSCLSLPAHQTAPAHGARLGPARGLGAHAGGRAAATQDSASADELKRLREAAKKSKGEPDAWHAYAVALERAGDAPGALKAFEEAVKRYVKIFTDATPGRPSKRMPTDEEIAARRAQSAARLKLAGESIERYFALGGKDAGVGRSQLEALRGHARLMNEQDARLRLFSSAEVDKRARILSKPEPGYSDEARQHNVYGRLRLRAVLASDRTVRHIFVVQGLPHGLNEMAVEAARRIVFEPATKDGQTVSQTVILEYNFNFY